MVLIIFGWLIKWLWLINEESDVVLRIFILLIYFRFLIGSVDNILNFWLRRFVFIFFEEKIRKFSMEKRMLFLKIIILRFVCRDKVKISWG